MIDVKRRWAHGDDINKIIQDLKQKEREKLLDLEFVSMNKGVEEILKKLIISDQNGVKLCMLIYYFIIIY